VSLIVWLITGPGALMLALLFSSARGAPRLGSSPTDGRTHLRYAVEDHLEIWRRASVDAAIAFSRWHEASRGDRRSASLAYFAAVEREEKAAREYERAWMGLRSPAGERRTAEDAGLATTAMCPADPVGEP
jgi:hypothetical protein